MAVVDFLRQGRREVIIAYFNHGTEHGNDAEKFVTKFCQENNLKLHVGSIREPYKEGDSKENYWRNERYWFFRELIDEYNYQVPLITCHHLDDQVETWIFTSLHGNPRLIPYLRNSCIIRPFLTTRKEEFLSWCKRRNVEYVEDPSNDNISYMRNHIRHNVIPQALIVNPGIHKTILKKTRESYENS